MKENCKFIALFGCLVGAWAFSFETTNYALYKGDVRSMFGYSVSVYRDQSRHGWAIVGAPLNRTSRLGVERGGAVFRCDIYEDNRCYPIEFDAKGVDYVQPKGSKKIEPIDEKSYEMLGATVSASMTDGGPLLACAPKYRWFGYIKSNWSVAGFKDVVGACWLTDLSGGASKEYSPCRNNDTAGHHRQGMCQAGASATLTKDGKKIYIGAPGSWYWQGQLFTIDSNVTLPFMPQKDHNTGVSIESEYVLSTKEGPAYEDNNYLGYSVAVGDFLGTKDSGVAVGSPRSNDLYGKVLLFNSLLQNHRNITGDQMGAYFGYALAVNDVDGDSKDDLIITAPFYTQPENAGVKIETGRIYVFYQDGGATKFQKFETRDGENNRGQFGISVASLGDIDHDGYGDFVVGEPYGGLENRGAVYIYRGMKGGVEEKYSQVIQPENLEQPVRTFGWSVSGGLDLDDNGYPDLVVGSYESDTAVFFRARPVVSMGTEVNFLTESIDLNSRACVLSDGTAVACSDFKVCSLYNGKGTMPQYTFKVTISLDDKKKNNPRLFFLDYETKNVKEWRVTMKKDVLWCQVHRVYVLKNLRDKLTALDASVKVELEERNDFHGRHQRRDPRMKLSGILNSKNVQKRAALNIKKNCGADDVCVPDLILHARKTVDKVLVGSKQIVDLEITIQNAAEDAFEATFYLQLPNNIDYVNAKPVHESNGIILQCTPVSNSVDKNKDSNYNTTVKCDVGNPLPRNGIVKFKVSVQPVEVHGMQPIYALPMSVNSSNPENKATEHNNEVVIDLPIWVETDISVEGRSKPPELQVDLQDEEVMQFGPILTHNYTIRNYGPSSVHNLTAEIIWAAYTQTGNTLLYLMEQPEFSSEKVTCVSANADPEDEDIDAMKRIHKPYHHHNRIGRSVADNNNSNVKQSSNNNSVNANIREEKKLNTTFLCATAKCLSTVCYVSPLYKDEEVWISTKYRVNITALRGIAENEYIRVPTKLRATVTSQQYLIRPAEAIIREWEVTTLIRSILPSNVSDMPPLWIIILAACLGILILLLLIFLLYKCGFFKRNRPSNAPEKEPLNRS